MRPVGPARKSESLQEKYNGDRGAVDPTEGYEEIGFESKSLQGFFFFKT